MGRSKKVKILISIIGHDYNEKLVSNISKMNDMNMNILEKSIWRKKYWFARDFVNIQGIKDLYNAKKQNVDCSNSIFRILFILFTKCDDANLMDHMLNSLNLDNDTISKFLNYSYPKQNQEFNKNSPKYDEYDGNYIIASILKNKLEENLKKIVSIIGDNHKDFIQNVCKLNEKNLNVLEQSILHIEASMYEYLLSIDGIKNLYKNENDQSVKQSIYRILYILFVQSSVDDETIESVIKSLNLKTETIADFMGCQYPKSEQKEDDKNESFADYKIGHNIIGQLISKSHWIDLRNWNLSLVKK